MPYFFSNASPMAFDELTVIAPPSRLAKLFGTFFPPASSGRFCIADAPTGQRVETDLTPRGN
jgi:hypothetical protein